MTLQLLSRRQRLHRKWWQRALELRVDGPRALRACIATALTYDGVRLVIEGGAR